MRNTTKLKQVLLLFNIDLSMNEDESITMTLVNKTNGNMESFQSPSYSTLISKSHSFFLKQIKKQCIDEE